jgi:hypothetical protein
MEAGIEVVVVVVVVAYAYLAHHPCQWGQGQRNGKEGELREVDHSRHEGRIHQHLAAKRHQTRHVINQQQLSIFIMWP